MAAESGKTGFGTQLRKARYQITRNVFVNCYLDILEANSQEVRVLLGVKQRSDTLVPVGTRIYLNTDTLNQPTGGEFKTVSLTVLKIEEQGDRHVHVCGPISQDSLPERRKQARKAVEFPVLLVDSQTVFFAGNGTDESLGLVYAAQKAILKLTVNQTYDFKLNCKGQDCVLKGLIRHIQYDWRTFQHRVGVHFPNLTKDERIILNLMVDPAYRVPLSDKQTVDTSTGKISLND